MHEGEHGILEAPAHRHEDGRRFPAARIVAAILVCGAVVAFLAWRFL
jgi:hypothetical protein